MPSGVRLSEKEFGQIMAYNDSNVSHREIPRRNKRSQTLVSTFLADPENYGTKKSQEESPNYQTEREKSLLGKLQRRK